MKIWELLGGLLSLIALVLWIRWLLTPSSSASWPRKIQLRVPFLYIIPAFLLAFGAMGVTEFALSIGALENLEAFTYGISALVMFPPYSGGSAQRYRRTRTAFSRATVDSRARSGASEAEAHCLTASLARSQSEAS